LKKSLSGEQFSVQADFRAGCPTEWFKRKGSMQPVNFSGIISIEA
jgi:hypothetical protein